MTVPQTIRAALSRWDPAKPVGMRMPVSRGQILRVAQGPQPDERVERLVLVLGVDDRREFAEIMFVHPYPELATGSDVVVPSERSRVAYQIVVETDVRGVVWLTQLGSRLGVLEQTALEAVGEVAFGEHPAQFDLVAGLPLRGRFDRRWDFKATEGAELRTLAADCTAVLLDGQETCQLDVGVLSPVLLAAADDFESALLTLLDIIFKRDIVLELDDLKMLEEIGALEVANWTGALGDAGREYYESLVSPLIERALSKPSRQVRSSGETASVWADGRKAQAGEFRPRSGVRVVSASYVFEAEPHILSAVAREHDLELIDA